MNNQNFTQRTVPPFRADIVGSFLRPGIIRDARSKWQSRQITAEALRAAEDEEIRKLVQKEKEIGLKGVTDGEFRRSWWHLDFMWGLDGIEKKEVKEGYHFHGIDTRAETVRLSGKIGFGDHPFIRDFRYLNNIAGSPAVARQTIPSPAQVWVELFREGNQVETTAAYRNREELAADLIQTYRDAIQAFYNAGCRNLQLDDCTWGMLVDSNYRRFLRDSGGDPDREAKFYAYLDSASIQDHPSDMSVNMHVCRGNYHSAWAGSGGYEPIAEALFGTVDVDGFYLEYDSDRAGGFEPLRFIKNQLVVLGLVTSKSPELEDKDQIKQRIAEAAKFVPLDRLCLSPQCGFASTEEGNLLTEEDQWKKLRLIREIADEVWG
jgi:5-methyltetrahydropteroyltriglutamate--homocysteine methyltransferase